MKEYQFKIGCVWLDVMAESAEAAVAILQEGLDAMESDGVLIPKPECGINRVVLDVAPEHPTVNDIFQVYDPATGETHSNPHHPSRL